MDLVVLGLNHRTAPLEVRERFDFSKVPPHDYLEKLAQQQSVTSGLVLSTCNRVEVYVAGTDVEQLHQGATHFLQSYRSLTSAEFSRFFYDFKNREAVRHLFRVASSLDSMVVGEPQILGQVKEAYFMSAATSLSNPFLDRLLQKTFSVAKRIRSETALAQQAVSVSYAAVELAKKIFGSLKKKTVLVIGAGEMAELVAKHLQKEELTEIFFANRSYEHSVSLVGEYGGVPIPFEHFEKYMAQADIVIVSTSAPHYLVKQAQVQKIVVERKQEPMFFIDISVPRNVDPEIDQNENVYLFNIDDLQSVVSANVQNRQSEATKAEAIVEAEVEQFYKSLQKREASPLIAELTSKYEQIRSEEVHRLLQKLNMLSPEARAEVERFAESLIRKILHEPISFIKEEKTPLDTSEKIDLIRKVFALNKDPKSK